MSENFENVYDRMPRDVWYCMRKAGSAEKYVSVEQDIYKDTTTEVRRAVEVTGGCKVRCDCTNDWL